eukprot:scaffold71431_cov34-Phaeocystis_antarctica.AAC.2
MPRGSDAIVFCKKGSSSAVPPPVHLAPPVNITHEDADALAERRERAPLAMARAGLREAARRRRRRRRRRLQLVKRRRSGDRLCEAQQGARRVVGGDVPWLWQGLRYTRGLHKDPALAS